MQPLGAAVRAGAPSSVHVLQPPAGAVQLPPWRTGNLAGPSTGRQGDFLQRDEGFRTNVRVLLDDGALDGALVIDNTGHGIPDAGVLSRAGFEVSIDTGGFRDGSLFRVVAEPNMKRLRDQLHTYGDEIARTPPPAPRGYLLAVDGHRTLGTPAERIPRPTAETPVVLLLEQLRERVPPAGVVFADPELGRMLLRHQEQGGAVRVFAIDPRHPIRELTDTGPVLRDLASPEVAAADAMQQLREIGLG